MAYGLHGKRQYLPQQEESERKNANSPRDNVCWGLPSVVYIKPLTDDDSTQVPGLDDRSESADLRQH